MSYENWKNKAQGCQTVDVRHIQGSFFEAVSYTHLDVYKRQVETGTPVAFNRDSVNRMNPNGHTGMIYC